MKLLSYQGCRKTGEFNARRPAKPMHMLMTASSCVAVGFCTRDAHLDRPPGWDPDSWGYHGDDGQAYCCHHGSKPYGQTFGSGDTVGCGLNFRTGSTFFTKNGYRITGK